MNIEANTGILAISGSVHSDAVEALRCALLDCLSLQPTVEVDLSAVDMLDTAAMQVFIACRRTAMSRGKGFRIIPTPFLRETMEALGLSARVLEDVRLEGGGGSGS